MRWIYWIFGRGKRKGGGGENEMGKKCKCIQERERKGDEVRHEKTADFVNVIFCVNKSVGKVGFNALQRKCPYL